MKDKDTRAAAGEEGRQLLAGTDDTGSGAKVSSKRLQNV